MAPAPATLLAPDADALDFAEFGQAVGADEGGQEEGEAGDADEAEVGFFEEVLEVHAVEAGDEGAAADAEGADGEFEVEQDERVAVGVKDGFDSGGRIDKYLSCLVFFPLRGKEQPQEKKGRKEREREKGLHLLGVSDIADQIPAHLHNLIAHLVVTLQQ